MNQQPSFLDWLVGLPWWAKLIIAALTAFGLYVSIGPWFQPPPG